MSEERKQPECFDRVPDPSGFEEYTVIVVDMNDGSENSCGEFQLQDGMWKFTNGIIGPWFYRNNPHFKSITGRDYSNAQPIPRSRPVNPD